LEAARVAVAAVAAVAVREADFLEEVAAVVTAPAAHK